MITGSGEACASARRATSVDDAEPEGQAEVIDGMGGEWCRRRPFGHCDAQALAAQWLSASAQGLRRRVGVGLPPQLDAVADVEALGLAGVLHEPDHLAQQTC